MTSSPQAFSPQAFSVVSLRYANALIDLAEEGKCVEKIEADLAALKSMLEASGELSAFVASPVSGKVNQQKVLEAIADKAKLQSMTRNFLGVLVNNGRIASLGSIVAAAAHVLAERRGEVTARIEVAQPLDAQQSKALSKALSDSLGAKVSVQVHINPDIIGGMIATVGSYMVDDSVRRKLERLRDTMARRANQNDDQQDATVNTSKTKAKKG